MTCKHAGRFHDYDGSCAGCAIEAALLGRIHGELYSAFRAMVLPTSLAARGYDGIQLRNAWEAARASSFNVSLSVVRAFAREVGVKIEEGVEALPLAESSDGINRKLLDEVERELEKS